MSDELPVEYDMSFSTNSRINYLLWKCNQSMEQDNPLEWMKSLKNLLKEASIDMKDDEMKVHRETLAEAEKTMNEYNEYIRTYDNRTAFNPPRKVFDILFNWEIKLRKKLDRLGLLMKKSNSGYSEMV